MVIDGIEKLYLAGFPLLQLFVAIFPVLTGGKGGAHTETQGDASKVGSSTGALEFLPLMLTSVYCAVGLVWAFVRLSVIYLRLS